jgi:hypothetical protein
MLSRPQVIGPVSVLTRFIRIQGQLVGATVSVASIGPNARTLLTDIADASDTRLELPVGEGLRPDDRLVAVQVLGGDSSPAPQPGIPLAVGVQLAPTGAASDLSFVSYVSNLWECGKHVWLRGGVPGARAVVEVAGTVVGTGHFWESEGARLSLREGLSSAPVSAKQSVPGIGDGPTSSRVPLALPGAASTPLPAPIIYPTPLACQSAIHVSGVYDGAEVIVGRSDGRTVSEQRSASDTSALWITVDELTEKDELTVHQEVDKRCERSTFATSKATVGPQGAVPIPTLDPLCLGAPVVTVKDLLPNAQVELNINGLVVRGQAPPSATTLQMIVEPLGVGTVSARQLQCSTWSELAVVPVDAAPAVIPPFEIVQPLHRCSSIVA